MSIDQNPPHAPGLELEKIVFRRLAQTNHLKFTRYFFKHRQAMKFIVNWHHVYFSDLVDRVIKGEIQNLLINVPPGSSKTEMIVINLIARGLAINPWCRFLHLSYSDDLALLNSQSARDLVESSEYQELWPMKLANDAKAKGRWNVMSNGKKAGSVYATSIDGQVTGFRAGHMRPGFNGAILIDDPNKPDDMFSEAKTKKANRKLLTTIKSRKANPKTPIIVIMQRLGEKDASGFIQASKALGEFHHVVIPAIITPEALGKIPQKYHSLMDSSVKDEAGNFSYWEYKEPIAELNKMKRGEGSDSEGSKISRFVFASQYDQDPVAVGGNIIRGSWFQRYKVLPKILYKKIFADTAQKTKEANDYSVFLCVGLGEDGKLYLLDIARGKWEAPELESTAIAFWAKHAVHDPQGNIGNLREMMVEDKASGTGLIQSIKRKNHIPIKGIERQKDKFTRIMDVQAYIEQGLVSIPENSPWVHDFIQECEAFTSDDTHAHDDQIDPLIDAINDILSSKNKLKIWENLI